jgi:hypothetical protein
MAVTREEFKDLYFKACEECDRLEAIIESGPHAHDCLTWVGRSDGSRFARSATDRLPGDKHCNCWKAEALAESNQGK